MNNKTNAEHFPWLDSRKDPNAKPVYKIIARCMLRIPVEPTNDSSLQVASDSGNTRTLILAHPASQCQTRRHYLLSISSL